MAAPSTFSPSGTVPLFSDTRVRLWVKKLSTIQGNLAAPKAHNNPLLTDTIERLRFKAVRAARGD